MGVTTHDIYGASPAGEPATPGSYGEAPGGYRLPDATHLGAVRLKVADLDRSLAYYQRVLGFRSLAATKASGTAPRDADGVAVRRADLAAHGDDRVIITLEERRGISPVPRRGRVGLFHFAILLPTRAALGAFVRHLSDVGAQAGAGDHLVSEAFYLHDPDGLGIEVYADRPRATWRRVGRELMMATDPVDIASLLAEAGDSRWEGMPAGTVIGHVHLHVGELVRGSTFYSEAIGFDRMAWSYPGALFFGAGGYHHHLGTNVWAGAHAQPPREDEAQLLEWTIVVPDAAALNAVAESLRAGGFEASHDGERALTTRDPWGTRVRVVTPPAPAPHSA